MKKYGIPVTTLLLSIIFGIASDDLLVGGTILTTGLLCSWYAGEGKRLTYILGFINYILMAYVSIINNLYGIFFFYIFLCTPLQIHGFLSWNKKLKEDKTVEVRKFNLKTAILVFGICIIGSICLGVGLSLIPSQRLAFLDAFANCINICGIVLMNLRFKEAWWLWLINNIIDTIIWVITFTDKGEGAFMMLMVAIGYLLLNIYGIIKWQRESKKEAIKCQNI